MSNTDRTLAEAAGAVPGPVRILLVDDHLMVRQGIRALLSEQEDFEVVAEASNGIEALQLSKDLAPNVLVMDVSMPDMNGMEATRRVLKTLPGAKVVALSVYAEKRFVHGMLSAGAAGYILKHCAADELVRAVRTVLRGQRYLAPQIAGVVVDGYISAPNADTSTAERPLTQRERETLKLIAEGKTTRQIAAQLNIGVKTVETHRKRAMDKAGLTSIADVTKFALREGLTTLEF